MLQALFKGAVSGNVIRNQDAAGLERLPDGCEFPAHVFVGVQAIVNKHVQAAFLLEQLGEKLLGRADVETPAVAEVIRYKSSDPLARVPA
jgi:hypothetical protein